MDIMRYLSHHKHIEAVLSELHEKYHKKDSLNDPILGKLSWRDLFFHHKKTAKLLAKLVKTKQYRYEKIQKYTRVTNNKQRRLCQYQCFDVIINKTIHHFLYQQHDTLFINNLFSYRDNRCIDDAQETICRYIKNSHHNHNNNNNLRVDLYVYQTDIKNYTDNIPIGQHSPLWKKLQPLIQTSPEHQTWINELITQALRPTIYNKKKKILYCDTVGLPMGSPLTVFIANLYLNDLDHELNGITGGLYTRFGDDIVFMHPDKNTVLQAKKIIYAHLKRLQLEINQDKEQLLYLTKAGRPCEDHCFTGTSTINYLGYGFNANGYTGLKKGKTQKLIQTVRTRLQRICNALSGLKLKKKAKILSQHLVSTLHTQSYETLYYQQQMNKISDPKRKHQLHLQLSHEISTMCTGNSDTALFFHLKYCVCLPIVSQIEA